MRCVAVVIGVVGLVSSTFAIPRVNVTLGFQVPLWSVATEDLYQAYQLALHDINSNPDQWNGLNINMLRREVTSSQCSKASGARHIFNMMEEYGEQFVGVIGAGCSSVSSVMGTLGGIFKIPQVSYASTNPNLSDKVSYPFFRRVIPEDTVQGKVLAEVVARLGYDRVALIYSGTDYGAANAQEFTRNAVMNNITITGVQSTGPMDEGIKQALETVNGGTYVLVAILQGSAGTKTTLDNILEMGLKFSLVIFSETSTSQPVPSTVIGKLTTILATPGINQVAYSQLLDKFAKRPVEFRHDPIAYNATSTYCTNCLCDGSCEEDDYVVNGTRYIRGTNTPSLHVYAPFVFDSIHSLALALNSTIAQGLDVTDGDVVLRELDKLVFSGYTGPVSFDANGDRLGPYDMRFFDHDLNSWSTFGIANFAESTFTFDESLVKWQTGLKPPNRIPPPPIPCSMQDVRLVHSSPACVGDYRNLEFEWNPNTRCNVGTLPDQIAIPCDVVPKLSRGWAIAMGISTFSGLFCTLFLLYILTHLNEKGIRFLQPTFICVFLLGLIIFPYSSLVNTGEASSFKCMAQQWVKHLTLCLTTSSLFARLYRVHRIFSSKKYKVVTVSIMEVMKQVVLCVSIAAGILIAWQVAEPKTLDHVPQPVSFQHNFGVENDSNNTAHSVEVLSLVCSASGGNYESIMYFAEVALLLYGCYLAFILRQAPNELTGGNQFGFALYNAALTYLGSIVVRSMVPAHQPLTILYIDVVGGLLFSTVSAVLVIAPVVVKIWSGHDFSLLQSATRVVPGQSSRPSRSSIHTGTIPSSS